MEKPILLNTPNALFAGNTNPVGFRYLSLNVSRQCNHKCSFCWTSEAMEVGGSASAVEWFNDEVILALFMAFREMGGEAIATMADGEPLFGANYELMKKVVATAGKLDLGVLIFTNGELLDKKRLNELYSLNNKVSFSVSIDSTTPAIYDEIHGRNGAFERVIQNQDAWKEFDAKHLENGFHRIGLHTVISARTTEEEMEALEKMAKELGDLPWVVSTMGIAGTARTDGKIVPEENAQKKLIDKYRTGPIAKEPGKNDCAYIASHWHKNAVYGLPFHPFRNGAIQPCPYLSMFGSQEWFSLKKFIEENGTGEISNWLYSAVLLEAIIATAAYKIVGYEYCIMRHPGLMEMESFFSEFNMEIAEALGKNRGINIGDENYFQELVELCTETAIKIAGERFGKQITVDAKKIGERIGLKELAADK